MSDSWRHHGLQPTRLLHPWDFPGKSTGVGCHCLLRLYSIPLHKSVHIRICITRMGPLPALRSSHFQNGVSHAFPLLVLVSQSVSSVAQSCPTLCDPMNRSTPGLPVHHQLPELTQTHVHRVCDAIQPSHPLSTPSPPAPNPSQHQSLFQ